MDKAMANTLDLAAYLDRLNWHGPTERTYATLYQARALGRLSGSPFSFVGLCDPSHCTAVDRLPSAGMRK